MVRVFCGSVRTRVSVSSRVGVLRGRHTSRNGSRTGRRAKAEVLCMWWPQAALSGRHHAGGSRQELQSGAETHRDEGVRQAPRAPARTRISTRLCVGATVAVADFLFFFLRLSLTCKPVQTAASAEQNKMRIAGPSRVGLAKSRSLDTRELRAAVLRPRWRNPLRGGVPKAATDATALLFLVPSSPCPRHCTTRGGDTGETPPRATEARTRRGGRRSARGRSRDGTPSCTRSTGGSGRVRTT